MKDRNGRRGPAPKWLARLAVLGALGGAAFGTAGGANPQRSQSAPDPEAVKALKPRIIAIPLLYYTPETKIAFGAGSVLNFRVGQRKEKTRPSSLWLFAVYTQMKQFQLAVRPEVYFANNSYLLSGTLKYERTPQKFYGIGNDVPTSAEELYTPRIKGLQAALKKRLLASFYAGLHFEIEETNMEHLDPGGVLQQSQITGGSGGVLSGFGFSLSWDDRDNVLFPRRGYFLQLDTEAFGPASGSDFTFRTFRLDLRTYIPFASTHVLALQVFLRSVGGDPPFYRLSLLGGDSLLRGYYRGRYRDKTIVVLQAEYRASLTKRIGLAGFAGLGDVAPGFGSLRIGNVKYSLGSGVRYKLDTKEGTNLRMDLAWGKRSFGVYFTAQEAF